MNEERDFPEVKPGDWIRFERHWLKVVQVYEPERIRCQFAPDGSAYLRDFVFREGWWDFERPSPDGAYLPASDRTRIATQLRTGPPTRWVGSRLEYIPHVASVWIRHDWPKPSNPLP